MTYLTDQSLLLLYCLGSLLFVPAGISFVIAFFLAVSACSILYVQTENPAGLVAVCCFVLTALFVPELICFAPAAACFFYYALTHSQGVWIRRYRFALVCGTAVFFFQLYKLHEPRLIFYVSLGIAVAVLLCFRAYSYEKFAGNYRKKYDTDHEKKLLLEAENLALIRQQNSEIYAATLKERTRIAREIHDNVGHMLTRSILMVGALRAVTQSGPGVTQGETGTSYEGGQSRADGSQASGQSKADASQPSVAEPLAQLEDTLNEAMCRIRESVHDLHDSSVDLEKTLRAMTEHFLFCPVTLQYDAGQDVPTDVRYCMIAVTREALVNISRHSNATKASVTVQEHPAFYQLLIRDNGTQSDPASSKSGTQPDPASFKSGTRPDPASFKSGMRPDPAQPDALTGLSGTLSGLPETSEDTRGIGLSNMQSRVSALNGSMRILRENGFGIHITIPKS